MSTYCFFQFFYFEFYLIILTFKMFNSQYNTLLTETCTIQILHVHTIIIHMHKLNFGVKTKQNNALTSITNKSLYFLKTSLMMLQPPKPKFKLTKTIVYIFLRTSCGLVFNLALLIEDKKLSRYFKNCRNQGKHFINKIHCPPPLKH